ncbi:zinc finger MYM-type protein 6-like [Melanaphis sacchari]|uniref:zinc finger MYM-type protein 6-like n=1 Tax=Melanaphis sacchari TaxID=742174 RepID=UPI000DC145F2|nr:zinc finger MYM-type protein 6-like [Melanaphis sacchari]
MNSDDESAIETKVRKVSEMSSDVQTSRKVNKKDRKYQDSYIKFGFTFDVEKEINEIPWSMCVSICTDGAAALTGSKKGFKAKVLEVSSNIMFNHCMIHREALASKKLQPDVNKVLLNAISVINFIKSK